MARSQCSFGLISSAVFYTVRTRAMVEELGGAL